MHKEWCGKACGECSTPCELDSQLRCSLDCEYLGENGERSSAACQSCDANYN